MRYYIVCFLCLLVPVIVSAQLGIGLKAGLNFANVTNTAGFKNSSRTGYMIGGYISPKAKKILGFRSELILSNLLIKVNSGLVLPNNFLLYRTIIPWEPFVIISLN